MADRWQSGFMRGGTTGALLVGGNDLKAADEARVAALETAKTADEARLTRIENRTVLWRPSAIPGIAQADVLENFNRGDFGATAAGPTSGTLRLTGGFVIPAGRAVTKVSFWAVGATVNPTHQWFCLVDTAG